jgi:hypothetical protein
VDPRASLDDMEKRLLHIHYRRVATHGTVLLYNFTAINFVRLKAISRHFMLYSANGDVQMSMN